MSAAALPEMFLALSGGVGGAKLASGLVTVLAAQQLAVVCNTADDFEHLGLPICPDLDTVLYTLGGRSNQQQGWGRENESWRVMGALSELGAESWFQLGDLDLATHLYRLNRRIAGASLTQITTELAERFGVRHAVWPMSDDPVRTMVRTGEGSLQTEMAFQHYFVRERCAPQVSGFRLAGIESARPQAAMMELIESGRLAAIIICPSNPFVSVDPILRLPGLRALMKASTAPIVAVSPIVGGMAIKGPAAKMMRELGMPVTARAVAEYYGDLLDGFVIDNADAGDAGSIESLGLQVKVCPTVMKAETDRVALALEVLRFVEALKK